MEVFGCAEYSSVLHFAASSRIHWSHRLMRTFAVLVEVRVQVLLWF